MTEEILVHISTPATRQNDDLYRSLADGYLSFEPHLRHGHEHTQTSRDFVHTSICKLNTTAPPVEERLERAAVGSSILSTSKDSYGSFPSHLSSEDQLGGQHHANVQSFNGSFDNGSILTSSRLAHLDRIHKHWKQTTSKSNFMGGQQRVVHANTPEQPDTAFIEDTQVAVQTLQSQLQDNNSTTSEDTTGDEDEPQNLLEEDQTSDHVEQDAGVSVAEQLASVLSTAVAVSGSVSTDQQKLSGLDNTLDLSISTAQASTNTRKVVSGNHSLKEAQNFSHLRINAFPPAPKISIERPGKLPSQVTKHLAAIRAQNPKRFKIYKKLYTPKYDDRGYWSVDCSSWPDKLQCEFWSSLCDSVLKGTLGWGTTLHREASSPQALGPVRLYCWAEVAEHIWLLMWLCSKGKIVGSNSKWIDADDAVVFEVP